MTERSAEQDLSPLFPSAARFARTAEGAAMSLLPGAAVNCGVFPAGRYVQRQNAPKECLMKQRMALFLFSLLVLVPLVHVFGTGIMEARNLISAQSMALDGDWLIPHLYTEIRLNKPPLPVWLTVPVFLLDSDPSPLALHIPVILVTALLGVFCFDLHRLLCGESRANFYAGLVSASMLMTIKLGTANSWDIYSVVFMTGSLAAMLQTGRGWLAAGTLCMAASILSKGPVQLYTMLLPFLLASLLFRRAVSWRRLAFILIGGGLLGSLWYLYVWLAVPHVAEVVARGEVSAWSNRHTAPFWFYLSFPAFAGAWALPALAGLGGRRISRGEEADEWANHKFLLCWFGLSLLLLSLVPEKKERYMMPALVPYALQTAVVLRYWVRGLKEGSLTRLERNIVRVHIGAGTLAAAGICGFIAYSHQTFLAYALLFALLALLIGRYGLKRPERVVPVTCLLLFCAVFAAFRMGSARPVVQSIAPTCSLEELHRLPQMAGLPFYSLDGISPVEEWEVGRDITCVSAPSDIPEQRFVLVDTDTTPPGFLREGGEFGILERILVQTTDNKYLTLFLLERRQPAPPAGRGA